MTAPIVDHYARTPYYSPTAFQKRPRPVGSQSTPGQLWERVAERLYHDEQFRGSLTKSGPRVRNYEYATAASGIIRAGKRVK